jgi:flagellar L-ring protein precursor FlgH
LWDDRQSKFFTDARALSAGDILTVEIQINDRARFRNESERSRTGARSIGLAAAFGWGSTAAGSAFGDAGMDSNTASKGAGATARSEDIELSVAAVVTDVLPNGNLVITGSQEVLVNHEIRVLTISGIVRPSDIRAANTISYERIAEARISYGGRGRITEVQQPGWGHQVLDNVLPF